MPAETLTYAALGARLTISPKAARSLAKRLRLPCSLSDEGKALVSVDVAEMRYRPRPPGRRQAGKAALAAKIAGLEAEIARLEATAAGHRADFERERERADHLMVELLQATKAAEEATARLEGFLRSGVAERRPGHLAADLVAADRKASGSNRQSSYPRLAEKS
jgi:hypothetical protein